MGTRRYPCGKAKIKERRHMNCTSLVRRKMSCGHVAEKTCQAWGRIDRGAPENCQEPCDAILSCGHPCKRRCGEKHDHRDNSQCTFPCSKILICGHRCANGCGQRTHTNLCKETCEKRICYSVTGHAEENRVDGVKTRSQRRKQMAKSVDLKSNVTIKVYRSVLR